jgi:hypothetical protein
MEANDTGKLQNEKDTWCFASPKLCLCINPKLEDGKRKRPKPAIAWQSRKFPHSLVHNSALE